MYISGLNRSVHLACHFIPFTMDRNHCQTRSLSHTAHTGKICSRTGTNIQPIGCDRSGRTAWTRRRIWNNIRDKVTPNISRNRSGHFIPCITIWALYRLHNAECLSLSHRSHTGISCACTRTDIQCIHVDNTCCYYRLVAAFALSGPIPAAQEMTMDVTNA